MVGHAGLGEVVVSGADLLDLLGSNPGEVRHEVRGILERRREAGDEHRTADRVSPPAHHGADLRAEDATVGVNLVEEEEPGSEVLALGHTEDSTHSGIGEPLVDHLGCGEQQVGRS